MEQNVRDRGMTALVWVREFKEDDVEVEDDVEIGVIHEEEAGRLGQVVKDLLPQAHLLVALENRFCDVIYEWPPT